MIASSLENRISCSRALASDAWFTPKNWLSPKTSASRTRGWSDESQRKMSTSVTIWGENGNLFADRQESGPFALWYHRHRFLNDGQGSTLLRDEVEYKAPLGLIGSWLGGWLIRRKLERMFAYRHETTRRLIESGEWKAEERPVVG